MSHFAIFASASLTVLLTSCGIGELRQQRATLEALLSTNAPLSAVNSAIGRLPIYRPGDAEWSATRGTCARYAYYPGHRRLLNKIDNAAAFGMTSTPTMMTYIFLDDQNRLIDFEVNAQ